MAYSDRSAAYALILKLLERPHTFDFLQVVRRIECASDHNPRIGAATRLDAEPVRFAQEPSLAFPSSTIQAYESRSRPGVAGPADRLHVNFMGLFGPNGPLPLHLTEYARDRERHARDPTFRRFCDIFHHRMIALFYRAWAVNQPAVSFDRFARDPDSDRFGVYVASLFGLGLPTLRRRDALMDIDKQHFAGRLAHQSKPPEGLAAVIADYCGVPCELVEFRGRWIDLPESNRLRLGAGRGSGTLGVTTIVGSRVWDVTQTFRLRVGPMTFASYLRFLPGGRTFPRVVSWARGYVGYEFDWDLQVVLKKEEVPGTRLGGPTTMLGWTTWLKTHPAGPMASDRGDLVLRAPLEWDGRAPA